MEQSVGFIGLGNLGTPIALNLLASGQALHVYNRTASKADPLRAKGAVVCQSVAELAGKTTVVFTMVSDDEALKRVCEGAEGLFRHLPPGAVHVSMSTILPQTAAELAAQHRAQGQHYLAAPVFGRPEAAIARKLNFAVSGPTALKKQMDPLLHSAGAAGIWDFGEDLLAANTVKLCGNFLIAAAIEAIGESTRLAKGAGIDAARMWEMFTKTLFTAPPYVGYSKIIQEKAFEPAAFTMKLGLKDINLILQLAAVAREHLPLALLLQKNMQDLVDAGKGHYDWSAVAAGTT